MLSNFVVIGTMDMIEELGKTVFVEDRYNHGSRSREKKANLFRGVKSV